MIVYEVHHYDPKKKGTHRRWFPTEVSAEAFAKGKTCWGRDCLVKPVDATHAQLREVLLGILVGNPEGTPEGLQGAAHKVLANLGHIPSRCGDAFECPRCGADGVLHTPKVGPSIITGGIMLACGS